MWMYPKKKGQTPDLQQLRMDRKMGTGQSNTTWDCPHKDQPHNLNLQAHLTNNIGCSPIEVPVTHYHHRKTPREYLLRRRNQAAVQVTLKKSLPGDYID